MGFAETQGIQYHPHSHTPHRYLNPTLVIAMLALQKLRLIAGLLIATAMLFPAIATAKHVSYRPPIPCARGRPGCLDRE